MERLLPERPLLDIGCHPTFPQLACYLTVKVPAERGESDPAFAVDQAVIGPLRCGYLGVWL